MPVPVEPLRNPPSHPSETPYLAPSHSHPPEQHRLSRRYAFRKGSDSIPLVPVKPALVADDHHAGMLPKPYPKPCQKPCLVPHCGSVSPWYPVGTTSLPLFMPQFLTVKAAAVLTGKSPSSIRRVLYPIVERKDHPDRSHILPPVDEVAALRVKGENFAWRLSEELLRREFPADAPSERGTGAPSSKETATDEAGLLAMLRRELDIKNQQITQQGVMLEKQMELISGLSERLREGNILIGSLQQRLALTDGRESPSTEPVKAKRTAATTTEKGSATAPKTAKQKRGFLSRLFR